MSEDNNICLQHKKVVRKVISYAGPCISCFVGAQSEQLDTVCVTDIFFKCLENAIIFHEIFRHISYRQQTVFPFHTDGPKQSQCIRCNLIVF